MRAAFITGYGDNSVVSHGELPEPVVGPDEVLIEIRGAGLNPVEPASAPGFVPGGVPLFVSTDHGL